MALGLHKAAMYGVAAGGGGPPAEIAVDAVHFDGSNDWLTLASAPTSTPNSPTGVYSGWFLPQDDIAGIWVASHRSASGGRFDIERKARSGGLNKLTIDLKDSSDVTIVDFTTTLDDFQEAQGWRHLLAAWDLTGGSPVFQVYVDDAVAAGTFSTGPIAASVGWAGNTSVNWGSIHSGNLKFNGDQAQQYLNAAEYLDISDEAVRRLFISAAGKPVDLGAAGKGPTGNSPSVFLTGPTATWHNNLGHGGGFTENGALTDAATSPSD